MSLSRVGASTGSLVVFTVLAQAAIGLSMMQFVFAGAVSPDAPPLLALVLLATGSVSAALHLSRLGRSGLALTNLRSSPLSREMLVGALYALLLVSQLVLGGTVPRILAGIVALSFGAAIVQVYRIRTVPAWDTWTTSATFFLTSVLLGSALFLLLRTGEGGYTGADGWTALPAAAALLQLLTLGVHVRRLGLLGDTAAESARILTEDKRGLFMARIATTLGGAFLMLAAAGTKSDTARPWLIVFATAILFTSELLGRTLFYASHRRVGL